MTLGAQNGESTFKNAIKMHQHNEIEINDVILESIDCQLQCCIAHESYLREITSIKSPLPGCLIIRNGLSIMEQQQLLYDALIKYPNEYPTVLQKDYELDEGIDIFESYRTRDVSIVNESQFNGTCPVTNRSYARKVVKSIEKQHLLKKLRWTLLGREFDWINRVYTDKSYPIPDLLTRITNKIIKATQFITKCNSLSIQAGVCNYYKLKDRMMAHIDHSEKNMSIPLVSISLGASCVFLMGTTTLNDAPIPIKLHSGDILMMYNECRYAYHAIPRIIETDFSFLKDSLLIYFKQVLTYVKEKNLRVNINVRQIE